MTDLLFTLGLLAGVGAILIVGELISAYLCQRFESWPASEPSVGLFFFVMMMALTIGAVYEVKRRVLGQ